MFTAALHAALPDGVPEWVHLVPAGTFSGRDGRGPYRLVAPEAVIAASMAGAPLPIDENHATDHAAASGIPSPARGWIDRLEARPDGIWGHVDWTPTGTALMAEKSYRGISPVFVHDKNGVVLRVLRAALTNTPNLDALATLHDLAALAALHAELTAEERDRLPAEMFAVPSKRELPLRDADHVRLAWDMLPRTQGLSPAERAHACEAILARARQLGIDTRDWDTAAHTHTQTGVDMDPTPLRAALGLPETADEAAVLAAVRANAAAVAAHQSQVATIAAAAGVAAATTEQLVTALQAQRAGAADSAALANQVVALQTQLQMIQADTARQRATAFVDAAIRAGKPIVPLRDRYIARHAADPEGVEGEINALPSINAGGLAAHAARAVADDEDPLTDTDVLVAKQMGLEPKAFAQHKRRMRLARENGGTV